MDTFRNEALKHHNDTEYGDIILPTSFGISVCAAATLFIIFSFTVFIYYGSYTRKAHLTGIVMPSSGLVKITPQFAGYVTRQTVSEGQHVVAGESLYHISGEHYNGQGIGTLAVSVMERYKKLVGTHYVSDIEYQKKQIDVSTAQQNVEDQRQGLLQLHTAMEAAEDDLNHLIVQGESRKAELDRQL
ncbi:TPA: secretion protein HlyD, partial [Escherichia coli]|nr:biotin/lipoyl-binding protein [Escherichia coli]